MIPKLSVIDRSTLVALVVYVGAVALVATGKLDVTSFLALVAGHVALKQPDPVYDRIN